MGLMTPTSPWAYLQQARDALAKTDPSKASLVPNLRPLVAKKQTPEEITASQGLNIPQIDYSGMQNQLKQGTLATGEQIPQWKQNNPYQFSMPDWNPYKFSTPNIQNVPQQAYQGAYNQIMDNMTRLDQKLGAQAESNANARGLGRGGIATGMQAGISKDLGEQASGLMRDIGLQQAQSSVDVAKTQAAMDQATQAANAAQNQFGANLNQWMQQNQAGENNANSQLGLQGKQALSNIQLQQMGAMGTLGNQAAQQAMQPWQMLMQLYGQNVGIPQGQGGKGDPFTALLNAGSGIAGMFA